MHESSNVVWREMLKYGMWMFTAAHQSQVPLDGCADGVACTHVRCAGSSVISQPVHDGMKCMASRLEGSSRRDWTGQWAA